MKRALLFLVFSVVSTVAFSQQSNLIFTGGWATVKPEGSNTTVNGYKLGAYWEFPKESNNWTFGGVINYLHFQQPGTGLITSNLSAKYTSLPVSGYAKYLIGKGKFQGYAKASAGIHYSTEKLEGTNGLSAHDFGFAFGTGVGAYYHLSEKVFLNADYEFMYQTNGYYNHGMINSVNLGIGFRLELH